MNNQVEVIFLSLWFEDPDFGVLGPSCRAKSLFISFRDITNFHAQRVLGDKASQGEHLSNPGTCTHYRSGRVGWPSVESHLILRKATFLCLWYIRRVGCLSFGKGTPKTTSVAQLLSPAVSCRSGTRSRMEPVGLAISLKGCLREPPG